MALAKARYQGGTQHGGSGSARGQTEKIPYNPDILKGMFDNGRVEGAA